MKDACGSVIYTQETEIPTLIMRTENPKDLERLCEDRKELNTLRATNAAKLTKVIQCQKRMSEKNFNPMQAWATGCQLASLYLQSKDTFSLLVNDGRFLENGNCGYVLKPDMNSPRKHGHLKVKIICGSFLPSVSSNRSWNQAIRPYVEMSVCDIDSQSGKLINETVRTDVVEGNTLNPAWGKNPTRTYAILSPDVSMLQFAVKYRDSVRAKSDNVIAAASIPVSCIRNGYRSIQLRDVHNAKQGAFDVASLLVLIRFTNT